MRDASSLTVQVLLSTYNGEAFLAPLLESVLAQDHPAVALLVRDDGSSDRTLELLKPHAKQGRIQLLAGSRLGVSASYFELLERSDPQAAFVAFCDQDDVWLPDKLSRAVVRLQAAGHGPRLYCGRQTLVDAALHPLGRSPGLRRQPALGNALVENVVTGCTAVMDSAARDRLNYARPRSAVLHDWWAYLVVSAFGKVLFDDDARVLYRQHGGNVVGCERSWARSWSRRVARRRLAAGRLVLDEQAREFRDLHGPDLLLAERTLLDRFLARRRSWLAGLGYALAPDVFRQGRVDDLVLRMMIALRRI